MICVICKHGETKMGHATVTLERDQLTLVLKDVPAEVCQTCGEEYVSEETTAALLRQAEHAAGAGVLVEVRSYAAA